MVRKTALTAGLALLGLAGAICLAPRPADARAFFSVGIGVPLVPGPYYYAPPPVVYAPPPVVYGQPVSYSGMPAYDSYGLYSSSYARYYVEASVPVRHDYRYGHGPTTVVYDYDRGHVPPPHGRYHQPPVQVVVERPPRTYVQPPYIIPPSGSTTVVTPITHTPTVPTYGTNPGTISVVQPVQRVPRLPTYGPTPHY